MSEAQKAAPDWTGFVVLLERAAELAVDAGAPALADAASIQLIRVMDENLGDPPAALAAADRLAKKLGAGHRIVAAKAKVLWRSGAVSEALEIYARILPGLDAPLPYSTDIWREAAMASARAKDWPSCASRFAEAVASLGQTELVDGHVGYLFDYGLALHLASNTRGAVEAFGLALDRLIKDGREPPPEPLLSIRQWGSQAIKLVLADAKGKQAEGVSDPVILIGAPSSPDTLNWGEQRPASTAILASLLLELDLAVPGPLTVAVRLSKWIRQSKDALTLATTWSNFNWLAIATSDMAALMSDTIRELSYLTHLSSERDHGRDIFIKLEDDPPLQPLTDSNEVFFIHRILMAIVALLADERIEELPLRQWLEDLPTDTSYHRLREFLADVETVLFGPDDPYAKVIGKNATWSGHALVAIAALGRDRTPAELITAQCVAAHYLNQPQLADFVAEPFSRLVTHAWERLSNVPALLDTPRLSVPAIKKSVESTKTGWARTKAVLQAALNAVSSGTANQVRNYVASLPDT